MIDGVGGVQTTQGAPVSALGPAADYPMVLGEPFTVDGELYTPADTLNYDAVGYAGLDDGPGVTAAHRTLPLPSYVEITSLESGKTILARVERRGPMVGNNLVSLSAAAAAQLGVGEATPVRVRRVNPPEVERAELRAGRTAPERMETPKSLVEVLRRKLPAAGAASLVAGKHAPSGESVAHSPPPAAPTAVPQAVAAYPLPPVGQAAVARQARPATRIVAAEPPRAAVEAPVAPPKAAPPPAAKGAFVIQAGAFASRANADRAAKALGGFVSPSGRYFRVRTGPFATRTQADAALAKVRAAGYSDARVTTAN
jgi:rare lipoprotein A